MIFGVVSLVYLAVVLTEQEKILAIQKNYFLCEIHGNSSTNTGSNCSSYLTELGDYTALGTTTFTLLGLLPLVFFMFMVNWKKLLKKASAHWRRCCSHWANHDNEQAEVSTYSPVSTAFFN